MTALRIGTRGSKLALAQAEQLKALLQGKQPGLACELVVIKTSGDDFSAGEGQVSDLSPEAAPSGDALKGLFVKEIEEALLDGRVDLAVHSAKDLESDLPAGLAIAAALKREDPRDALVAGAGKSLKGLAPGARVGVSSLRRLAQMKRLRRDLEAVPVRGNVDTRLKKLESGEYDALLLAACGLKRLGLAEKISEVLDPAQFLPAPGQGALAVQARADRQDLKELLAGVDDPASHQEMDAERAMLKALGGSCRVPVGGLARIEAGNMTLEGVVLSPDGLKAIRKTISGPARSAERLGKELASHLRAGGADRLLYGNWKGSDPFFKAER